MEIIGAAALIAVGIVLAAVLYGRTHGMHAHATRPPQARPCPARWRPTAEPRSWPGGRPGSKGVRAGSP